MGSVIGFDRGRTCLINPHLAIYSGLFERVDPAHHEEYLALHELSVLDPDDCGHRLSIPHLAIEVLGVGA